MSDSNIIGVKCFRDGDNIHDFSTRFHKSDLARDFSIYRLSLDSIRPEIQRYITEHGLSSLFYNTITCDAIMHPGLHTDEIEAIVLGIMQKLDGVRA